LTFGLIAASVQATEPSVWGVTASADEVAISYNVYGQGQPTLVFVHGWSCDSRYWREQVPFFAGQYRVVTLDLAGHGHSDVGRAEYTMQAFGQDVKAVVKALQAEKVILIGHSMGGGIIAEAARLMPQRVIGLIAIDTLQNVEHPLTVEEMQQMVAPFERDFKAHVQFFVKEMMVPGMDHQLQAWIVQDMAAAPPTVAISAFKSYMGQYVTGAAATVFEGIQVPVYCVNADMWPVDYDANRRHMQTFEAMTLADVGHFLMLEKPVRFNDLLDKTITKILIRH
jgi:pimeloyl-ACP methyl ester carboxylesterase